MVSLYDPKSSLSLLIPLLALTACEVPSDSVRIEPVVYGADDRYEVFEHPSAVHRELARNAVAVLVNTFTFQRDSGVVTFGYRQTLGANENLCPGERFADQINPGMCSGTLIDDRFLLTAEHCIQGCDDSQAWVFGFRYEADGLAPLDEDDVYHCRRVLAARNSEGVDHAIVMLDRPVVGRIPAPVRLDTPLAVRTPLVLIGHPGGIPMKIAADGRVVSTTSQSLRATLDAFEGNSGSGVFDEAGYLVALLTSGEEDYVRRGQCNVVNRRLSIGARGEGLTYARPAIEALCVTPGVSSSLCGCDGPCVESPPGDQCVNAEMIEARTQTLTGTLEGYAGDEYGSCGGSGPDRFYRFVLPVRSQVHLVASGFDTMLYLRHVCDGPVLDCNDDQDPTAEGGLGSLLDLTLEAGTYILTLDAYDLRVGPFTLSMTVTPLEAPTDDAGVSVSTDDAGVSVSTDDAGMSVSTDDAGVVSRPGRDTGVAMSEAHSPGCGCRVAGAKAHPSGWLGLLAVLALALIRRVQHLV